MDGPKIAWRPGRIDGFAKDVTPDGRLPDATKAQDHLRDVSSILRPHISSFLMASRFFTVWVSMTRRLSRSLVHMRWVDATPTGTFYSRIVSILSD